MQASHLVEILMKAVSDGSYRADTDETTRTIHAEMLRFGSETPNNLDAIQHVVYGAVNSDLLGWGATYGLHIRGKPVLLSNLMNMLEGMRVSKEMRDLLPDLAQEEWDAAFRVITLILASLEYTPSEQAEHS